LSESGLWRALDRLGGGDGVPRCGEPDPADMPSPTAGRFRGCSSSDASRMAVSSPSFDVSRFSLCSSESEGPPGDASGRFACAIWGSGSVFGGSLNDDFFGDDSC